MQARACIARARLLLLLLSFATCRAQTCSDTQFQSCCANFTGINLLIGPANWDGPLYRYVNRVVQEFNVRYPGTHVTLHRVPFGEVVAEALQDVQEGFNFYAAFILPMGQHVATFAPYLYDVSSWVQADFGGIGWGSLGRFFRSNQALYESRMLVFPFDGDFHSLYYRSDYFEAHGITPPRTIREYVDAAAYFQGRDLDGDGNADYGSCFSHHGFSAPYYFWSMAASYLQYGGTRQGIFFDLDLDLAPPDRQRSDARGDGAVETGPGSARTLRRQAPWCKLNAGALA